MAKVTKCEGNGKSDEIQYGWWQNVRKWRVRLSHAAHCSVTLVGHHLTTRFVLPTADVQMKSFFNGRQQYGETRCNVFITFLQIFHLKSISQLWLNITTLQILNFNTLILTFCVFV